MGGKRRKLGKLSFVFHLGKHHKKKPKKEPELRNQTLVPGTMWTEVL